MTFDIQSVAPEWYEVVDYRTPFSGEYYLLNGKADVYTFDHTSKTHLILKKKWTPKVGEVVAVRVG